MYSTEATALGESNNAGVRGGRCGDFTAFFQKYAFLGIFWSKFLLKTAFLNG